MGVKQGQWAQNAKVISFLKGLHAQEHSSIKHETGKCIMVWITVTTTIKRIMMCVRMCVNVLMCLSTQNHWCNRQINPSGKWATACKRRILTQKNSANNLFNWSKQSNKCNVSKWNTYIYLALPSLCSSSLLSLSVSRSLPILSNSKHFSHWSAVRG